MEESVLVDHRYYRIKPGMVAAHLDLYEQAGFKLMRTERHKSWGRPVVSEYWDLEL